MATLLWVLIAFFAGFYIGEIDACARGGCVFRKSHRERFLPSIEDSDA
jgi:hypothetical protein